MPMIVNQTGRYSVVKLTQPRLDAVSAPDFRHAMQELVAAGHSVIALDLSDVQFVDSSGLGALVAALKSLNAGELVLCGANETVMRLFKLTRMDLVFKLYPDVASATAV